MTELEESRKSARHWKQVAIASWIVIAIMGVLFVAAVGGGAFLILHSRARAMQEREMAEQARYAAEKARAQAEAALKARN
jgi:hypothetical protein